MKRYMIIEHFAPGAKAKIYERFHQKGRMLPDGLVYIDKRGFDLISDVLPFGRLWYGEPE